MLKLRVGVLMGGKTIEKEVSFNSGRTICDHLDTTNFTPIPIFQTFTGELYILPIKFLHRGKISDFEARLAQEAEKIAWDQLKALVDYIYLAVHGRYAEDGTLQGMLEVLNIPYLGSNVFTSAITMDKIKQRDFLELHGIAIPRGITVTPDKINNFTEYKTQILNLLEQQKINFPVIVKPHQEGSSLGISIVSQPTELAAALELACNIYPNYQQPVLVEEKVQGLEFSAVILEDLITGAPLALPPTEIEIETNGVGFFDYEQKYMPGRALKHTPARCSAADLKLIQAVCIKVKSVLDIKTIARIDGFLTPDSRVIIIDPNTLSGMSPSTFLFLQAAEIGMSHTSLINHLIYTDLKRKNLLGNIVLDQNNLENLSPENLDLKNAELGNNNLAKIRVAVLFGGDSNEREISLESGRNVIYKLSPQKYTVIPLFLNSKFELHKISNKLLVRSKTTEIAELLDPADQVNWSDLPALADFVFIALHGGKGENGAVQGALEMLGLPYNGSGVFTSALCMDKFKTNQLLTQLGFTVPQNYYLTKINWDLNPELELTNLKTKLNFPLIIKPADDGCSVFVEKVTNQADLLSAINKILVAKDHALIEEFIVGTELTIGVIGNQNPQALPPSKTVVTHDVLSMAEKFLPGAGENQTPAPLPTPAIELAQKTVRDAYQAVGCAGYARIDCFYQDAQTSPTGAPRIIIIEFNTLPALTPATCLFHQAAELGIRPMDFINLIIQLGFEKHVKNFKIDHQEITLSAFVVSAPQERIEP